MPGANLDEFPLVERVLNQHIAVGEVGAVLQGTTRELWGDIDSSRLQESRRNVDDAGLGVDPSSRRKHRSESNDQRNADAGFMHGAFIHHAMLTIQQTVI